MPSNDCEVFSKSLVSIFASVYQLLKRHFRLKYSLYLMECLQVLSYITVSKWKKECGRILNPFLLLLDFLFLDHHGKAAKSDVPRFAQLPGADYWALQLCKFGVRFVCPYFAASCDLAQRSFPFFRRWQSTLHVSVMMTGLQKWGTCYNQSTKSSLRWCLGNGGEGDKLKFQKSEEEHRFRLVRGHRCAHVSVCFSGAWCVKGTEALL